MKEQIVNTKSIQEGYNLPSAYFEVDVQKATSKDDAITVLNLEQLTGIRLKNFYVETDKIRGANTISSMDLSLFEKDCYKEAVKYSGGAIRDLFRIVRRAALIETSKIP